MKTLSTTLSEYERDNILIMNSMEDCVAPNTQSSIGHYYAKKFIADNIGSKVKTVKLKYTQKGKPYYDDNNHISISHTGDYIFVAFSNMPVGIDGELLRKINPNFIYKVLAENELEEKADFNIEFLKAWTLKEAYLKLIGELTGDLESITKHTLSPSHTIVTNVTEEYIMTAVTAEK